MRNLLTISEAAAKCFGGRPSTHSIRRWIARGIGRPPVRLKSTRVGGAHYIDPVDAEEFLAAIADPELHRRRKASEATERAKKRLVGAGA